MCKFQDLLTASSHNMFNLTNGRVQVKTINIRLPHSWQACAPASALVADTKKAADVLVTPCHPLLGDLPWTIQFGGCGQQGKNIQLPVGFLRTNRTLQQKSLLVTKEWVKLKFGVFEEDGFHGDALYPATFVEGKSNLTNAGCPGHDQVCRGGAQEALLSRPHLAGRYKHDLCFYKLIGFQSLISLFFCFGSKYYKIPRISVSIFAGFLCCR